MVKKIDKGAWPNGPPKYATDGEGKVYISSILALVRVTEGQ